MTENKLESFVKGSVIKQTFEIISGKREHYNLYRNNIKIDYLKIHTYRVNALLLI